MLTYNSLISIKFSLIFIKYYGVKIMSELSKFPIQNANIVLREESDDWAILFDPTSGETYGLDPISIFVWKKLNGGNSVEDIVNELKKGCIDNVPDSAFQDVTDFVNDLISKGLASC